MAARRGAGGHSRSSPSANAALDAVKMASRQSLLRVPVVSFKAGLTATIERLLTQSASPAGESLRDGTLQLVEVPVPPPASTDDTPANRWELTPEQEQALVDATVVVVDAHHGASLLLTPERRLPPDQQHLLRRVRWVQGTYAGVDAYLKLLSAGSSEGGGVSTTPSFTLTRAGGILGMAQFVFGWVVSLERKFLEATAFQRERHYAKSELSYRSFRQLTVGVLGFGAIGQAIGRMFKDAGFQVTGFKRRPLEEDSEERAVFERCAHRISNDLRDVLQTSDFVVSILPSTPATRFLLTEELFAACAEKKPVFINVGRGDVVSEKTLLRALERGHISKVVLDVFEQEPLPQESALWTHPNVHLTPHVAAFCFAEDVADTFAANLELYLAARPMNYAVDWASGY